MKQRIPTFDDFINEKAKPVFTDKRVKMLNDYLVMNNERGADEWHHAIIPKQWKVFDDVVSPKKYMAESACYDNALKFAKENPEYKLVAGAFIYWNNFQSDKKWLDEGPSNKFNPWMSLYMHAFNLTPDGEVYDVTLRPSREEPIYIGEIVDPKKFKTGFGDLSDYIRKRLSRK